jgi:hypothetical protein
VAERGAPLVERDLGVGDGPRLLDPLEPEQRPDADHLEEAPQPEHLAAQAPGREVALELVEGLRPAARRSPTRRPST